MGRNRAHFIQADDLIARITAQTCRQSGLSVIYTELLDFSGDEIYFQAESTLTGLTFGEALLRYEDSTIIGLRSSSGTIQLNPPMDKIFQPGDQVIAISADDDTLKINPYAHTAVDENAISSLPAAARPPEATLILGWNRRAPLILNELDQYVSPGSHVLVVTDMDSSKFENLLPLRGSPQPAGRFPARRYHRPRSSGQAGNRCLSTCHPAQLFRFPGCPAG